MQMMITHTPPHTEECIHTHISYSSKSSGPLIKEMVDNKPCNILLNVKSSYFGETLKQLFSII